MEAAQHHDELMAGLKIRPGRTLDDGTIEGITNGGTLTGLATRGDEKFLVSNLHVIAGFANNLYLHPDGGEGLYQSGLVAAQKVGTVPAWDAANPAWIPVAAGDVPENIGDVCMARLDEGVAASYLIHEHPSHGGSIIISGVEDPIFDMELLMVGAVGGTGTIEVVRSSMKKWVRGCRLHDVMECNDENREAMKGDSGSPYLLRIRDGVYRMVGIHFASTVGGTGFAWGTKASVVQDTLGIAFGKRSPEAAAAAPGAVGFRTSVNLDGSNSCDPDGEVLTYLWEQTFPDDSTQAEIDADTVDITDRDKPVATFQAPAAVKTLTFKLTVTDIGGQTSEAEVSIEVERGPGANAGRDRSVGTGTLVTLTPRSDTAEPPLLSYRWSQIAGPSVTLTTRPVVDPREDHPPTTRFTAPATPAVLTFRLTVTNTRGIPSTADVTIVVRDPVPTGGEDLGVLAVGGNTSRSGSWVSTITSPRRSGSYAKFYTFSLAKRSRVQIDLTSQTDPYLYLLSGSGTAGAQLEANDDFGGSLKSRITRTLDPGTYTIDATTFARRRTGIFTLAIAVSSAAGKSNDAALAALSVDPASVTLSPAFSSSVESYTASVAYAVNGVRVTPMVNNAAATVMVNGDAVNSGEASQVVHLAEGANTIRVEVTAEDETTTKTYTIDVERAEASIDAALSALSISSGTLSPVFAPDTTAYTAKVVNAVSSIQITPTVNHREAKVTVNGTAVARGSASGAIALTAGQTANIAIKVTAEDGTTTKTYSVTVTRSSPVQALTADAGPDQRVETGDTVTLDGSASQDPDGDALRYSWRQIHSSGRRPFPGDEVRLSDTTVAKPTFTAPSVPKTLWFRLWVGDGNGNSDEDTVVVSVVAPKPTTKPPTPTEPTTTQPTTPTQPPPTKNRAPVADAGDPQSVDAGASVTLDGSGSSDPDGDTLAYQWTAPGGVTLTGANTASPTFTAPSTAGSLTFQLTVSDGKLSHSDSVTVTVNLSPPTPDPASTDATLSALSISPGTLAPVEDHFMDLMEDRVFESVRRPIFREIEALYAGAAGSGG